MKKATPTSEPIAFSRLRSGLQRDLRRKQAELVIQVANLLDPKHDTKAAQQAIRRKEKSIALLTTKLICDHEITMQTQFRDGAQWTHYRCSICLGATTIRL